MRKTIVAVVLATSCGGALAAIQIEPGLWEFKEQVWIKLPSTNNGPFKRTFTRCVTKEEAAGDAQAWYGMPRDKVGKELARGDCDFRRNDKIGSDAVKGRYPFGWEFSCAKAGTKGKGWARFDPDFVNSQDDVSSSAAKLTRTTVLQGKRIGPCK